MTKILSPTWPTPAQARILLALKSRPDLEVYLTDRVARWDGPGYSSSISAKTSRLRAEFGTPRRSSVLGCVASGWLAPIDGRDGWRNPPLSLTDSGREIAANLTMADTAKIPSSRPTEAQVLDALASAHQLPEWIFIRHLIVGTGASRPIIVQGAWDTINSLGEMDAFALNCWPSKHFRRVAYEVKVSRSDFKHELEQPRKRGGAEYFANECYFAAPAGIVKPEELPERWGLIEIAEGRRTTIVKAQSQEAGDLTMGFIASMCRNIMEARE